VITKQFKTFAIILLIIVAIVSQRCAQPGTITGGPRDLDPPVMLGSDPEMFGTNFKGNKIQIDFNEFLQLKDVNQQLNVSPPLKKKPKLWLKSHSLVIEYSDTLLDNTTYTFNFGNCLSDNNEGNILTNFEFAFSTGKFIDSMTVRGRIIDAFTLKADKESVLAVLYSNANDSAPFKETPKFTSRADKDGYYSINNVSPGSYKLYALKDINFNYKYNPGIESFAFIDTLVVLDPAQIAKYLNKSYAFRPDTSKALKDTLKKKQIPDKYELMRQQNSIYVDLFSFTESDKKQFIKDYSRKDPKRFDLIFNNHLKGDSLNCKLLYFNNQNWFQLEKNRNNDSISLWITDTSLIKVDTLKSVIQYWKTTKKGDTIWTADTLNFRFIPSEDILKKSKKTKIEKMPINFLTGSSGLVDLTALPLISAQYPITAIDTSKILFTQLVDTIDLRRKYKIKKDSLNDRNFSFIYPWEELSNYKLTFYPGAFTNIYNIPHDTLKFNMSTQKIEFYGKIILNISGVKSPVILQLVDNDKVAYQLFTSKNGKVEFKNIHPKEYTLRAIYDSNNDKVWNTGYFAKKIQPEKVIYYKNKLNIRSNWDVDISWEIE
jgi:uncharacterized protein (DUF2141 family)